MKTVFAKAPLRLAMAGGGTDLLPYWRHYGGVVLNGTIDQYAYCKIEPYHEWLFQSVDLNDAEGYFPLDEKYVDTKMKLLINTYQYLTKGIERHPVKITTFVEAPPGSGLGRNICNLPGGKQDQFAAAFGGFNFIEFLPDGRTIVNPLRLNFKTQNMLELSTVLYYVGKPRMSERVIENTAQNLLNNDEATLQATHRIKSAAIEYKRSLLLGDVDKICETMNTYWKNKIQTNEKVVSPELLDSYEFALKNGAKAAKISGAGGGGHMILFTDFERRHQLISALKERNVGRVVPFKFVKHGVDVWRV
jgi:D-glycero-alpha-D-manno-heptose-7-phosphate kinase